MLQQILPRVWWLQGVSSSASSPPSLQQRWGRAWMLSAIICPWMCPISNLLGDSCRAISSSLEKIWSCLPSSLIPHLTYSVWDSGLPLEVMHSQSAWLRWMISGSKDFVLHVFARDSCCWCLADSGRRARMTSKDGCSIYRCSPLMLWANEA